MQDIQDRIRLLFTFSLMLDVLCRYTFIVLLYFFPKTGGNCPIPMDATFIIGSSGSIGSSRNWIRLLSFVQTLVTVFGVSPSGTHVSLIPYSTDPRLALKFNTLSGSLLSVQEVNRQVARLRWQKGFNRIDKAMDLADKEVLTSAAGMRDVPRVN